MKKMEVGGEQGGCRTTAPQARKELAWLVHEISKPATLICGGLDTLDGFLPTLLRAARPSASRPGPTDPELRYALEHICDLIALCREGAGRLDGMLRQLGRVARHDPLALEHRSVDLGEILRKAIAWSSHRDAGAAIRSEWPGGLCVDGDAIALAEAFVNLVSNARDALADTPEPRIEISANSAADGATVEVRVRDNGPGVPNTARDKIFQSFYTTKGASEGHGLGLAVARRIFAAHGGELLLTARREGSGAEFVVVLPSSSGRIDEGQERR